MRSLKNLFIKTLSIVLLFGCFVGVWMTNINNVRAGNLAEQTGITQSKEVAILDLNMNLSMMYQKQIKQIVETAFAYADNLIEDEPDYTQQDFDLLSRLVYAEAGSDWCSDEMQLMVANVVINRVNDHRFPNSIHDVIYQKGQYSCITNGMLNKEPNQRAIENAKRILDGERVCDESVIWQSEFTQGKGVYKKVQNMYFCY